MSAFKDDEGTLIIEDSDIPYLKQAMSDVASAILERYCEATGKDIEATHMMISATAQKAVGNICDQLAEDDQVDELYVMTTMIMMGSAGLETYLEIGRRLAGIEKSEKPAQGKGPAAS